MQGIKLGPSMSPLVSLWVIDLHNEVHALKLHLQLSMALQEAMPQGFCEQSITRARNSPMHRSELWPRPQGYIYTQHLTGGVQAGLGQSCTVQWLPRCVILRYRFLNIVLFAPNTTT